MWKEVAMANFPSSLRRTIFGASAGTLIEWYDFFLYGAVATVLAKVFFSALPDSTAYLFSLLTFAAGFLVRPLGALIFGSIGDRWGRKNTFLLTMILMGLSTITVGLLPNYETAGILSPSLLIFARLMQGLAVGGEYGGAATYVAEHAPPNRRGLATSFIQLTCTFGLLLAIAAVVLTRISVGEESFLAWGWRLPFLFSIVLLAVAIWIRLKLDESSMFKRHSEEGRLSTSPIAESFSSWPRLKSLLISTFCLTAGMTVIFYTSQFYVLTFLLKTLRLADPLASQMLLIALALASPFFIFFGWLSDKIGRKPIILTGFLLAGLTYFPLFSSLSSAVNPKLVAATKASPVTITVNADECSSQVNPIAPQKANNFCDALRRELTDNGIQYATVYSNESVKMGLVVGANQVHFDPRSISGANLKPIADTVSAALAKAGYPKAAEKDEVDIPVAVLILFVMVLYVAMAYGPLAAILVELFPLRIRYTSLSTSYNLSVGWIGGLLPSIAYGIVVATGQSFSGLWYPVCIALFAFFVGLIFVKEDRNVDLSL